MHKNYRRSCENPSGPMTIHLIQRLFYLLIQLKMEVELLYQFQAMLNRGILSFLDFFCLCSNR
jgi:hypothetical protein